MERKRRAGNGYADKVPNSFGIRRTLLGWRLRIAWELSMMRSLDQIDDSDGRTLVSPYPSDVGRSRIGLRCPSGRRNLSYPWCCVTSTQRCKVRLRLWTAAIKRKRRIYGYGV
ncbi:hypothetical protein U1Q18_042325 [Sarracenia purpurea var. burkii]